MTINLFQRAETHGERIAIRDLSGDYSYQSLLKQARSIGSVLLKTMSLADLQEQRIGFLSEPGFDYVATQWGIWMAGGVAVPLGLKHPRPELEYTLDDAQVAIVVAQSKLIDGLEELAAQRRLQIVPANATSEVVPLPVVDQSRRAMMLYTSGTTSKPKGVVTTHANIESQTTALVEAWGWQPDDHILHVLPLHHIHGIINVLNCSLWAGALCDFLPGFDAEVVSQRFTQGEITLFMAVPTIYSRLIKYWGQSSEKMQTDISNGCAKLRLMVSGSAALPVSTLEQWREITGHTLLERYGMTEIGMGLSNPLHGDRIAGHVGTPLPNIKVRRMTEEGNAARDDEPGELQVRGAGVFLEYWQRPEETLEAFDDGWFRTGDITVIENGTYRILGRNSVDIIKTGGYKVSALEIEEVLRTHPQIAECAVVGVDDDEWGERVAACIVATEQGLDLSALRQWSKELLAAYKIPTRMILVQRLPRNAMGKVQKPAIKQLFQPVDL